VADAAVRERDGVLFWYFCRGGRMACCGDSTLEPTMRHCLRHINTQHKARTCAQGTWPCCCCCCILLWPAVARATRHTQPQWAFKPHLKVIKIIFNIENYALFMFYRLVGLGRRWDGQREGGSCLNRLKLGCKSPH
jgi:hypothetical protein